MEKLFLIISLFVGGLFFIWIVLSARKFGKNQLKKEGKNEKT